MLIRDVLQSHPKLQAEKLSGFTVADVVVWRKEDGEGTDKMLGVQVKTTETPTKHNGYHFSDMSGYGGMPVVGVCLADRMCCVMDGTGLQVRGLYLSGDMRQLHPKLGLRASLDPFSDVFLGDFLLEAIERGKWQLGTRAFWEQYQRGGNHAIERETADRLKPFFAKCGITVGKPPHDWHKIDNFWFTSDGMTFRAQNKTAGWTGVNSYRAHVNMKGAEKSVWEPYHFNHFDLVCIGGPAAPHPHHKLQEKQLHFSKLVHVIDRHTLFERGITHNSPLGSWDGSGRMNLYFTYPGVRALKSRAPGPMGDNQAWMDEFLLDLRNPDESSDRLLDLLRIFSLREKR
eukprot:GDKI01014003.1.p1 GENE.GDKI01014003.1~~GDKI01014003.1.p1  ORF type:complete len:344 (+),score=25.01 GDKI01014003.1:298-1329(+)